jgi:hypothetical protein
LSEVNPLPSALLSQEAVAEKIKTDTLEPKKIGRRDWYMLVLILMVAAYLRLMGLAIDLRYGPELHWTLLSLVVIGFIWLTAYRYISSTSAIVAALMGAFNPSLIYYAGHLSNIIQLYLLMMLIFALITIIEEKTWATLALIMSLGGVVLIFLFSLVSLFTLNPNFLTTIQTLPLYLGQYTAGLATPIVSSIPRPSEIWLLFLGLATLIGFPALWLRSRTMFKLIIMWISGLLGLITAFSLQASFMVIYAVPALCLLAGAGVAWLIKLLPGKPYSRMIVLATYGAIFLSQGLWWQGVVRYLQSNP